jgi:A/G-specific adenine glycosylase
MEKVKKIFVNSLLMWYRKNSLSFPWRKTKDPYKILIAEILLRKTTRNQVKRIYEKFIKLYPNPYKLASSDVKTLENVLSPLGMQKQRARMLKRLAKEIVKIWKGEISKKREELLKLPGVGPYTANAVVCLAYGEDVPLVDTNVIRVISRVFGIKSKKRRIRNDPLIWSFVENLIPKGRGRDFNLALIDFANQICTHKSPRCNICPLKVICLHQKRA